MRRPIEAERLPISVCMVVRNEEHRIAWTLAGVRPHVAEIVLVDQRSTDRTVERSLAFVDVFVRAPEEHVGLCERSRALAEWHASEAWTLLLDADETPTEELWADLPRMIEDPTIAGAFLRIEHWIDGRRRRLPDERNSVRAFRRGSAIYPEGLHGPIRLSSGLRADWPAYVAIEHRKSSAEQQADWDRYAELTGGKPRIWADTDDTERV